MITDTFIKEGIGEKLNDIKEEIEIKKNTRINSKKANPLVFYMKIYYSTSPSKRINGQVVQS